jgi:serine phosphatase RsbU (regulator of sigma subunit)
METKQMRGDSQVARRIHCSEIWGGIKNADLDLCTKSVTVSLYSKACQADKGGDISYLAVCDSDVLTRIVTADVRGHGQLVSKLSQWIYDALRDSMDTRDGTTILRRLNRVVHAEGFLAMTTAVVASFYITDSSLSVCYAGHPPVLLNQHAESSAWSEIHVPARSGAANLPLGALADTGYDEVVMTIHSEDRIALYTDGVTECMHGEAEFGVEGLRAALGVTNGQPLAVAKQNVLAALERHAAETPYDDDITLLLIEAL